MSGSKCKYCGKKMQHGNIRCDTCNKAWQEGHKAGYDEHKARIYETIRTLVQLSGMKLIEGK